MQGSRRQIRNDETAAVYSYSLSDELGSGAFSKVFKGSATSSGQTVAIKIINKEQVSKYGEKLFQSIIQEVNILQRLNQKSENIINIFDVFESENHFYIVLEFCCDRTLDTILMKRKMLPEAEAVPIFF